MDKDPGAVYWSPRKILGYNREKNFVFSSRGPGKSYNTKWMLIENDSVFMCLYRQQIDLQSAVGSWLDCIIKPALADTKHKEGDYKPDRFSWSSVDAYKKGSGVANLYLDGELKGYFRYLSGVNSIKQEYFDDHTNWLWFDEFIPVHYKKLASIDSEGQALKDVADTINHDKQKSREERGLKPLRWLMYGNPKTWSNPIISFFEIPKPSKYGIFRHGGDCAVEFIEPPKRKLNEKIWQQDTITAIYLSKIDNSYIVSKPKGAYPYISLRMGQNYYCAYRFRDEVYWKRVTGHVPGARWTYGTSIGKTKNEMAVEYDYGYGPFYETLRDYMMRGAFNFTSIAVRNMMTEDILL